VRRVTIHGKGVEVGDGLRRLLEEALRAPVQPYGGREGAPGHGTAFPCSIPAA
jgi:hypothetical protein